MTIIHDKPKATFVKVSGTTYEDFKKDIIDFCRAMGIPYSEESEPRLKIIWDKYNPPEAATTEAPAKE